LQPTDLPPALDFEPGSLTVPLAQAVADVHTFLNTVQGSLGKAPIIYTNYNSWANVLNNPTDFSNYKLWIASYSGGSAPNLFGGWTEWTIWQYTDSGSVNGVPNNTVDMNRYNAASGLVGG